MQSRSHGLPRRLLATRGDVAIDGRTIDGGTIDGSSDALPPEGGPVQQNADRGSGGTALRQGVEGISTRVVQAEERQRASRARASA